ncbi:MAG: HAD family hydrolase, partial [Chloroflexaceae bacterium]|nr:HAD family hydrolase [Chloroflexaceae bacterium]
MAIKAVIFDFDGTIADTHQAIIAITNRLAAEFGYTPVDSQRLTQLKNLSSREIVKQAELPLIKLFFLLRRVQKELAREIIYLKPIPGMPDTLKILREAGYKLGIITSNSQENVVRFLEINQLYSLFEFIYFRATLFGKHRVLRDCLKQQRLHSQEAVYIGDETRDIEAAKRCCVRA